VKAATPYADTPYADTWEALHEVFEVVSRRRSDPIILSSLPYRPEGEHRHTRFPLVLAPPGRVIAVAVGLRAALPDTPLLLVAAADSVTLGTNHLIHAARRNIGMTLLLVRSDLLQAGDAPIDRAEWTSTGYQVEMERAGTPLEWATALQACLVGRGSLRNLPDLADLVVEAVAAPGFSVLGVTGDPALHTGVMSRQADWPEYFSAYRAWSDGVVAFPAPSPPPGPVVPPRAGAPDRFEVRIVGVGGQGVKLAGTILSEAAGLGEGLWATQFGQYGSATRGGPSQVDVVIGSEPISYPVADEPDVLVVLSGSPTTAQLDRARTGGRLVVDEGTLEPQPGGSMIVPITDLAREHTGTPISAGVTSLGCVAALCDAVSMDSLRAAARVRLPVRRIAANLAAMEAAYEHTIDLIGRKAEQ
jgi:2-oxoglutarate ferredoxin oxidoreductase subunit gamma